MSPEREVDLVALAQMRRRNGGVWRVTHVVEGYDDEHEQYIAGKLSQKAAEKLAEISLYHTLKRAGDKTLRRKHIILKEIVRES